MVTDDSKSRLKHAAIDYFRTHSSLYTERYSVAAAGDVLWPRHRALLRMVLDLKLPRPARFLDLGCGPGFLGVDLARLGYRGVGLDAAPAMIQRCTAQAAAVSSQWRYQLGDVEALPFRSASFDVVICAGVIEYLPTDVLLLQEVARVLKPSGRFLLCVTNRYGYTVSLNSVVHRVKQVPGVLAVASALRAYLVGGSYGAVGFTFLPRKHQPSAMRSTVIEHGFRIRRDRFVQFSVLPAPFCALMSRLGRRLDEQLDALDATPLRILGSCYIVDATREA